MVLIGGSMSKIPDTLRERLPQLWRSIEDAHYSYLETDDSPEKLQQRKKLEGFISEYLSLVPHECKFGLWETGNVFQRTIAELPDYSAYRASLGWAALARYAGNLLAQPWRREYKTIRLYCGFFKHEVEANMVGAEVLLRLMGYRTDGADRMSLDGPVCPDMVAAMSRDALIAYVECQMMASVWEVVWNTGGCASWAEVARERTQRTGDVAATAARIAHAITTTRNSKPHPTQHETYGHEIYGNIKMATVEPYHNLDVQAEQKRQSEYNNILTPEPSSPEDPILPMIHPAQYMMPAPHMMPSNVLYSMPPQHLPQDIQMSRMPMDMNPQCNPMAMMGPYGPMQYYYQPVQAPYMYPTPMYVPIKHATNIPVNGYPPPLVSAYRYPAVPTAQLIEFDSPGYEANKTGYHRDVNGRSYRDQDADRNYSKKIAERTSRQQEYSRRNSTPKSPLSDMSLPSMPRSDTQPALSKAREDGMGTYESWDYVFRNLSNREHDGDIRSNRLSPQLERDSRTLDRLDRDEKRSSRFQPTTLDLEDGLQALSLDRSYDDEVYRTAKVNENLLKMKQDSDLKKAKQIAKKQAADDRKVKKQVSEVKTNADSDIIQNSKIIPDNVRLLSKQDVKDKKDIQKQQTHVNGTTNSSSAEVRKLRKSGKGVNVDSEKSSKIKPITENGVHSTPHGSKSTSANHSKVLHNHMDLKTHLVVSLDETDTSRKSPSKYSDLERASSLPTHSVEVQARNGETSRVKEKWQCGTCTYLNGASLSACEICGKSRRSGSEIMPLMSGGRECPTCTLVNQRDATVCEACASSLDHCPTYI